MADFINSLGYQTQQFTLTKIPNFILTKQSKVAGVHLAKTEHSPLTRVSSLVVPQKIST